MKIFFHNYNTREGITSDDPQESNLNQAIEIFRTLNSETENYFGIIDESDETIQFVLEAENKWLIEIPHPPRFINDQKFGTFEECISIITETFMQDKITALPDMRKVDIRNETLEEVIQRN